MLLALIGELTLPYNYRKQKGLIFFYPLYLKITHKHQNWNVFPPKNEVSLGNLERAHIQEEIWLNSLSVYAPIFKPPDYG